MTLDEHQKNENRKLFYQYHKNNVLKLMENEDTGLERQ